MIDRVIEVPEEYTEIDPPRARYARYDGDMVVSIKPRSSGTDVICLLTTAYEAFGEPDAVRCFVKDDRVAIVPCDPDHPNAYSVFGSGRVAQFSAGWLHAELASGEQPPTGAYDLHRDGDIWYVDFADGPDRPSMKAGDGTRGEQA